MLMECNSITVYMMYYMLVMQTVMLGVAKQATKTNRLQDNVNNTDCITFS